VSPPAEASPEPDLERRLQFLALYVTRFAGGFGLVTLATLLPTYINLFEPSDFVVGLFTAGLTLGQAIAIVPLAWAGDRYDRRLVLLFSLALSIVAYVAFALVSDSLSFVLVRGLQGVAITGGSLIALSTVGELSPKRERANHIGKANAARLAAGVGGPVAAGAIYSAYGFPVVYGVLVVLFVLAFLGVLLFVPRDETRIHGFPFTGLAFNRRILTLAGFRAQYAVAVTLVRTWVPIYAGVEAARGGLGYSTLAAGGLVVGVVIAAEKVTNMLAQPYTGRLSDRFGRSAFVFGGGGTYGLVALAVPFSPAVGTALSLPTTFPVLGELSPAFLPLLALSGLLGVTDAFREPASMALFADEGADSDSSGVASSFGIRELVWRPGSVAAPVLGGLLMAGPGMAWVFYVGGAAAVSGALTFVCLLTLSFGRRALTSW
jgi:MFS family permease